MHLQPTVKKCQKHCYIIWGLGLIPMNETADPVSLKKIVGVNI